MALLVFIHAFDADVLAADSTGGTAGRNMFHSPHSFVMADAIAHFRILHTTAHEFSPVKKGKGSALRIAETRPLDKRVIIAILSPL